MEKNCNALSIYSRPQECVRPYPTFRDRKAFVHEGWAWLLGSKSPPSVFWKKSFHMVNSYVDTRQGSGCQQPLYSLQHFLGSGLSSLDTFVYLLPHLSIFLLIDLASSLQDIAPSSGCGSEKGIRKRTWSLSPRRVNT